MKNALMFVVGGVLGGAVGFGVAHFQWNRPAAVVRPAERPGAATLDYEPPPPPKIPVEFATEGLKKLQTVMRPEVLKVSETLYLAKGYALGNVGMVITDEGLVIVDTTESPETAEAIMKDFRKISDLPVRTVIYTHYHPDHTQGTPAFMGENVEVIGTRDLVDFLEYQNGTLGDHHLRARATQAGVVALEDSFPLPIEKNPFRAFGRRIEVVQPTKTFEREHSLVLGKTTLEIFHTSGETEDHLAVWLPDQRALFVGDLYYASFPNLSTPMLESRPVRGWIRSLERFIELAPELILPGHTEPLRGAEQIRTVLTNYRDAIRYVHDETVRFIEEGKTVDEAVSAIRLPPELAALPYLQEGYGRVSWSIRGIYRGYTGWYDGRGSKLHPLPPKHVAGELVKLAGGADAVLARAIEAQKTGEHQLAAELCDTVITANDQDAIAHRIKAASMHVLAYSYQNLNSFGFYRSAHGLESKAARAAP